MADAGENGLNAGLESDVAPQGPASARAEGEPQENAPPIESATDTEGEKRERSKPLFGGVTPTEAGRLSGLARARKREEAERAALDARLGFRGRLGVSLAKLSQQQLDKAIAALANSGRPADLRALANLADQAYGRPGQAEEEAQDATLPPLTAEARAAFLAEYAARQQEPAGAATDPRETAGADHAARELRMYPIRPQKGEQYPMQGQKGD